MQIKVIKESPLKAAADLLVLGLFEFKGTLAGSLAKAADKALKGILAEAAREQDFHGRRKQSVVLHTHGKLKAKRVALVGMGKDGDAFARSQAWLELGARAVKAAGQVSAKTVVIAPPEDSCADEEICAHCCSWLSQGAHLAGYRFDAYLSKKRRGGKPTRIGVALGTETRGAASALQRGHDLAVGVALARDLVNEPPISLYPESFAARAEAMAHDVGLGVKILAPAQLKRSEMNLLLGVGSGSARTPRLLHLTYKAAGDGSSSGRRGPVVLVGKGITFDSGGLCIKPAAGMLDMKVDMAGGAAVVGAMRVIAKTKPAVDVHGIVALAENMTGAEAIRPGDVIQSAAGKFVEINNTDAEGRLVLADAIHYARQLKPRCIIDLATLTGACMVALGPMTTGLFSNDDDLAGALLTSAERNAEHFWRMPLYEPLREQLNSDVADLKNTGDRFGGAITAALFLREFVGSTPWAHLDIAGPSTSKGDGHLSKGGTGVGVATLVDYVNGLS